jgi:hypothetical protein
MDRLAVILSTFALAFTCSAAAAPLDAAQQQQLPEVQQHYLSLAQAGAAQATSPG